DDQSARQTAQSVLCVVFEGTLRLLHPVAPFISEALWQTFPREGEALIAAPWPKCDKTQFDKAAEREMALMRDVVGAVRHIRGTMRIPPGKR
ncbi:MAG: class I tRNA ligase family protein, partial [Gemmatimonadota bacterium]|nr:class I tRNA ligase family protein [Gemmatimonadota bacterium]